MQVASGGDILNGREKILAALNSETCSLKTLDIADTNVRQPSPDTAILTYTATQNVRCEGEKVPPKVFATSVYVRQGGKWRWTNYQETVLK